MTVADFERAIQSDQRKFELAAAQATRHQTSDTARVAINTAYEVWRGLAPLLRSPVQPRSGGSSSLANLLVRIVTGQEQRIVLHSILADSTATREVESVLAVARVFDGAKLLDAVHLTVARWDNALSGRAGDSAFERVVRRVKDVASQSLLSNMTVDALPILVEGTDVQGDEHVQVAYKVICGSTQVRCCESVQSSAERFLERHARQESKRGGSMPQAFLDFAIRHGFGHRVNAQIAAEGTRVVCVTTELAEPLVKAYAMRGIVINITTIPGEHQLTCSDIGASHEWASVLADRTETIAAE